MDRLFSSHHLPPHTSIMNKPGVYTLLLWMSIPCTVDASAAPLYESDVRPILKAMCFHCHGEDGELEGNLDLRRRRLILKGGDSGPAFSLKNASESLILERIQSGEMPPGKAKLSQEKITVITKWIESGAATVRPEPEDLPADAFTVEERNFWSLQPIRDPEIPAVKETTRVRNPVDSFILAKLEQEGLDFAPDADRVTLIRRLYFDLIGLPPSPEEIDSFLNDERADAYEQLVDHLLESPHYGERWGRHWLDVAGYADSEGFSEKDPERASAFRYRDYVIRSFNADKPFDQFIVEQLAGDEFVSATSNFEPEAVENLTATGFLRMAPDGTATGGVDQNLARNQVLAETIKIVSSSIMGMTVGCAECHSHRYDPIRHTDYYAMRAIFEPALDWKHWRTPAAREISLYTDEDRSIAAEIEKKAKAIDQERNELTQKFITQTLDTQLLKLEESVREPLRVAYTTKAAERTNEQKELLDKYPKILKISAGSLYLYDREIRTEAAKLDSDRKKLEQESPEETQQIEQLKQQRTDLLATLKADLLKELSDKAVEVRATKPPEAFVRALTEVPGQVPETFLFYRGDFEQPKEKTLPAGLSVLDHMSLMSIPENDPSLPSTGRRLAFARRLTNGQHPLTARVLVNRFWLNHFGQGIVDTPGDFGYLGGRPTHPELLDWLATRFVENGWKLKTIHKMIVTSTTYRQSSEKTPLKNERDPDNKLYSRRSLLRLDAETVRDAVLSLSGQLNLKMFGEPVPVMEDAVGQIVIGKENLDGERKPLAAIDLHGEEFRRSLYIQVRRSRPLGVLSTFDMPDMEPNCTIRNSSTVTPQALMLMNSDFSAEMGEYFAKRLREAAPNDQSKQIQLAWKLAFGREPSFEQSSNAALYLTQQTENYNEKQRPESEQSSEELALTSFCQALIGSNGFLYID